MKKLPCVIRDMLLGYTKDCQVRILVRQFQACTDFFA